MARASVAARAAAYRADLSDLVGLAVLGASFILFWVAAWFAWLPVFLVAVALNVWADHRGRRRTPKIFAVLAASRLGTVERQIARDAALLLLALRDGLVSSGGALSPTAVLAIGLGLAGTYAVVGVALLLRLYLERLRTLPVETRNVDLRELRIPDAVQPAFLRSDAWPVGPWAVAFVGIAVAAILGRPAAAWIGVGLALVASLAAVAMLGLAVVKARHLGDKRRVFTATVAALQRDAPEVVLYHSGAPGSAYQVNMWLSTLERLDRPAMLLLRQPEHLAELTPTTLPIACVPSASDVMDLDLPSLRVALYVGNVGENVHLIRNGELRHVFVGHGDSDKAASANRVSRIFDEVWVAGPAGRERYAQADVGVEDHMVVEVGRPQLDELAPASTTRPRLTVLYAPTWEGWSGDMDLTSVPGLGPALVRELIADPTVRVIYRPHPLAGTRSPAVRLAHSAIVRELGGSLPVRPTIRTQPRGDAAQRSRDGVLDAAGLAAIRADRARSDAEFWHGNGAGHVVVPADGPSLYSCFDEADVLISDVSSVISDFIAAGKPYVVTNPQDLDELDFRATYPTTAGGYLLGQREATPAAIAELLANVRRLPDPMAEHRQRVREHLLGPAGPALPRFAAAMTALADRVGPPVGSAVRQRTDGAGHRGGEPGQLVGRQRPAGNG